MIPCGGRKTGRKENDRKTKKQSKKKTPRIHIERLTSPRVPNQPLKGAERDRKTPGLVIHNGVKRGSGDPGSIYMVSSAHVHQPRMWAVGVLAA